MMSSRSGIGKDYDEKASASMRALLQRIPSHDRPNLFGSD
jgi:hypothetical protein